MSKLNWYTRSCALFLALATAAVTLPAQIFKTLDSFDKRTAPLPGRRWSRAAMGVSLGRHRMAETVRAPWAVARSSKSPYAGLVQAANGDFCGVTSTGGTSNGGGLCATNCGTVFKITSGGKLTTLHNVIFF